LSNEITQFTSSPRRKLTYYSISNIQPVTQGPLTPQHANSNSNSTPGTQKEELVNCIQQQLHDDIQMCARARLAAPPPQDGPAPALLWLHTSFALHLLMSPRGKQFHS
jgi:hypothetical protein